MSAVTTIAAVTVRDIVGRKLFYIFLAIAVLGFGVVAATLLLLSTVAATASAGELGALSRQSAVFLTSVWWSLGTYGFAAIVFTTVWSDWKKGVVALLLTKSATRTQLIAGKMLGIFAVLVAYGLVGSLITLALAALLGQADMLLLVATVEGFLSLALSVSLVFVFACSFELVPALILWFLFSIVKTVLVMAIQASESFPWLETVTWLHYAFPVFELFQSARAFVQQEPLEASLWATVLPYLHIADYSILMVLLAVWAFNRRRLPLK